MSELDGNDAPQPAADATPAAEVDQQAFDATSQAPDQPTWGAVAGSTDGNRDNSYYSDVKVSYVESATAGELSERALAASKQDAPSVIAETAPAGPRGDAGQPPPDAVPPRGTEVPTEERGRADALRVAEETRKRQIDETRGPTQVAALDKTYKEIRHEPPDGQQVEPPQGATADGLAIGTLAAMKVASDWWNKKRR
jgi:hypothetical protein